MKNGLSLWSNNFARSYPTFKWGDFSDFFNEVETSYAPKCDVKETNTEFVFDLDLPGVQKENIKVALEKDILTISGHRETEKKTEENTQYIQERTYGEFQRSFRLPTEVEADKIEATHKEGVLTVKVPKAKASQPREIRVA